MPPQRSLRARLGRVVSRAHRFSDSPCWQVVPPGRAFIAVHAPDAHCWYCVPMQLNMPSDVQVPDLPEELPSEPVEFPEPEPPPDGERVADGAGLDVEDALADVSAGVDAGADEEAESVAEVAEPVADPESSEDEVGDATEAVVTGLT